MIGSGRSEELQALAPAEVEQFLVSLMGEIEAGPQAPDFDRLMGIGIGLARSQHEGADATVLQWLRQQPSDRRLDIASAVLNGLWSDAFRRHPVLAGNVDTLIDARDAIVPGADAEYGFVQALSRVLKSAPSEPVRNKIAAVLEAVAQRQYRPDDLDRLMKSAIQQALRHGQK